MSVESIVAGLNPEQRRAVTCTEGPLLVLAGAGSGKTRVLTHRIAYLIGVCGIPADSLLAVTFTNKAAGEMKERVEKLLGPEASELAIGTFHSICVRILRRDIIHLGRSRGFVIYDDSDSVGAIKEVLRRHDLDPKVHDPKRLRWRIDQWKNAGVLPAAATEQARASADEEDELAAQVYAGYQRLLLDANALDFGDILLATVQLFRQHPRVLEHYQRRWQYVLVDEYQDTNAVQYDFVQLLAAGHRNLCVVGDPDQSIYAWRGADVRNILEFERDHPDAAVVKLERNYRSTQPILSGASAVVSNNFARREKRLFTERPGGAAIAIFEAEDDRQEARYVVQRIARAHEQGRPYGHFAILYRTNAQSRAFEEVLLDYDIPYTVVGGVRFYERAEIKDAIAYLRLLVNPRDDQALLRIVNRPARGIGKTTVERASALAAERGLSIAEALARMAAEAGGRAGGKLRDFLALIEGLRGELATRSLDQLLSLVLDRSGYLDALVHEGTPEAESRRDNLLELIASARDFAAVNAESAAANAESAGEDRTPLELFLDQVALISDLDSWQDRAERVSLMTVHTAKGLEFPVVFLVGMEERIFPHASASGDDASLEEERRLCYVAMTRAMDELHVTHAGARLRYGERSFQMPSRFLREIPDALVERIGARRPESGGAASRARTGGDTSVDYSYSQESTDESGAVRPGTRVRHPVFGAGQIVAVQGSGLGQKLRIRFDRVGIKTVVVRYANLELL